MTYLSKARAALTALLAVAVATAAPVAMAAIDISDELTGAAADLSTVITGIGGVLIAAAAIAIAFRWAVRLFGK